MILPKRKNTIKCRCTEEINEDIMISQKVGIIIQAHMGSTRLPGKVLKFLDKNEKVLDILIKRMKLCKSLITRQVEE